MSGNDTLDINEWIEDYGGFMAEEALKILKIQGDKKGGPEAYRALLLTFMANVLTVGVTEALHDRPDYEATKKQIFEHNKKVYGEFKEQVQEMVAMAFQTALSHYSGKSLDYYCVIRPVPEPLSKKVN